MWNYLGKRFLTSILVLFGVSIFTFLMLHFSPGDPVRALIGRQNSSPERIAEVRKELGLDDPLPVQYWNYIKRVFHGNFGKSYKNNRDVAETIFEQFPSTVELTVFALAIAITFGLIVGAFSAFHHHNYIDHFLSVFCLTGISIPPFFLGLLLIFFFSVKQKWLPSTSQSGNFKGMILPAITLSVGEGCWLARLVRSSVLDELGKTYQTVAIAKGGSDRYVLFRHVIRNSLIPIITSIGLEFVYLLAGSVVVESIFARQGIGRLAVNSIQSRDFPVVEGTVSLIAVLYVVINTITDILYAIADPRIRLK